MRWQEKPQITVIWHHAWPPTHSYAYAHHHTHTHAHPAAYAKRGHRTELCALFEFEPIKFRTNHNRVHKPVYTLTCMYVCIYIYVKQFRIFYLNIIAGKHCGIFVRNLFDNELNITKGWVSQFSMILLLRLLLIHDKLPLLLQSSLIIMGYCALFLLYIQPSSSCCCCCHIVA